MVLLILLLVVKRERSGGFCFCCFVLCVGAAVLCLVVCEIMMMMLREDGHRKMAGFAQQCQSAAHKKRESVLSLSGLGKPKHFDLHLQSLHLHLFFINTDFGVLIVPLSNPIKPYTFF